MDAAVRQIEPTIRRVLVAIDFSPPISRVIETGVNLARCSGADLYLVHVAPPNPDFVGYEAGPQSRRDAVAARLGKEHSWMTQLGSEARARGVEATPLMVQGPTAQKILEQADRLGASLIVLGSHGHGPAYDLIVGSVARAVVNGAKVPVVLVPARDE